MSVVRILFYGFLVYLAYKIVFDIIIPVYRTTRQVKKQFREMNDRMNDYMKQQEGQAVPKENNSTSKQKPGDYIEYEEIK